MSGLGSQGEIVMALAADIYAFAAGDHRAFSVDHAVATSIQCAFALEREYDAVGKADLESARLFESRRGEVLKVERFHSCDDRSFGARCLEFLLGPIQIMDVAD